MGAGLIWRLLPPGYYITTLTHYYFNRVPLAATQYSTGHNTQKTNVPDSSGPQAVMVQEYLRSQVQKAAVMT